MADEGLTPEQIQLLADAIGRAEKRRKIMLAGYLVALIILLVGVPTCFVIVGRAARGVFVGWVFFVPWSLVGVTLWSFGRWAKRS